MSYGGESGTYRLKPFKYSSHYWILEFIARISRPARILEIGTADGYLGAILKEQGHFLVGVEQSGELAEKARAHYDRFHVVDIEHFDFSTDDHFDIIVFADVLEHLRDPATVLQRSLASLTPHGQIIVSVPNVANFFVRGCLLLGRFEYADRGILDRTHLRFFTLATLRKLLAECSCRCVEITATPIPIQLVIPVVENRLFLPLHEIHYFLVRLWKTFFGYQFVIRAEANLESKVRHESTSVEPI